MMFDPSSLSDQRSPARNQTSDVTDRQRTVTRADILERVIAVCPSGSLSEARAILEVALGEIAETLTRGESVKLRAFGQFTVREKRARVGCNPRTGVKAPITARRVVTFKPSPVLLDVVAGRGPLNTAGVTARKASPMQATSQYDRS